MSQIGRFCLNTKSYLRNGVEDLRNDPAESNFVQAVDNYLSDDKIHYWFYYNNQAHKDFCEVSHDAPKNERGEKPRFLDIWHPHEEIDVFTILSAVTDFANKFLKVNDIEIKIVAGETFEESFDSYREHLKHFGNGEHAEIGFSDDLIRGLSVLWKKSPEEVLEKLNKTVN